MNNNSIGGWQCPKTKLFLLRVPSSLSLSPIFFVKKINPTFVFFFVSQSVTCHLFAGQRPFSMSSITGASLLRYVLKNNSAKEKLNRPRSSISRHLESFLLSFRSFRSACVHNNPKDRQQQSPYIFFFFFPIFFPVVCHQLLYI